MATSLNAKEIEHFARDSARWWDEDGPFRPLHRLNPVRLRYIRARLTERFGLDTESFSPFKDLRVLDIGCGGGLVCEPMSRLGASICGIDADGNAIEAARAHAQGAGLAIDYRLSTAEALLDAEGENRFDVVLALEIVEHVEDRAFFIETCTKLCRPGGLAIFSTLNRTPKSFALGIVAAEHILQWVPRGTHDWKKFVKPSELAAAGRAAGLREIDLTGYTFNPLRGSFELSRDVSVNYFMTMEK